MQQVKEDFVARFKEIRNYVKFINYAANNANNVLTNTTNETYFISENLIKILIANGFLLIYNATEATVRKSVEAIYDDVETSSVSYDNLKSIVKSKWLDDQVQNLKEGAFNFKTLKENLVKITDVISQSQYINLDKNNLGISGNLDAQKIREISKLHGLPEIKNGGGLEIIKKKRNDLAHGDSSFSKIGQDYNPKDIERFAKEAFSFLKNFVVSVTKFIDNKDYIST